MHLAARIDEIGKPAWIALMVAGFIWAWPVGLGLLAYLGASGRLRAWRMERRGQWHNVETNNGCGWRFGARMAPSGNQAFDDYRADTIRRLEDEAKEFKEYLERLRRARDKAEFDQFMAERRRPTAEPVIDA